MMCIRVKKSQGFYNFAPSVGAILKYYDKNDRKGCTDPDSLNYMPKV